MTIAVIWQESDLQWCAADTRLVVNKNDQAISEIAAKIFALPMSISASGPGEPPRQPHYWTKYGFVYAGASAPATMTAATASTFLQSLIGEGSRSDPPTFEQIAEFVCKLSKRFMADRRQFGADGIFSASLFGWCPHSNEYKVAVIDGKNDAVGFRVELFYPERPSNDGDPWVILGSGKQAFQKALATLGDGQDLIRWNLNPRRAIEKMVADEADPTVGGATSMGISTTTGFEILASIDLAAPENGNVARRVFNGLDLDTEVGQVGGYSVGITSV